MKLNRTLCFIALTLGVGAPLFAHADTLKVQAGLTTAAEVPPKAGDGHGQLTGTYDTSSKELRWHVDYAGLSGPATAAHFHGPAPAGKNSGVALPIDAKNLPSPIEGHATLSEAQEKDLLAGNWYFNVHTATNSGGEIRGQVEAVK
ncbi:CHRD domain-containing protein [Trinickia terrae]|uniref:CHRD domain-containing protein n=1 Tax=Trinickia terrae TaxID=2571161 RepID=A0A4U1I195_9BURK|nr:CHRD domain-containing protein [Trinickia terrae]TKC86923.1 CHRD domain-containing protein [Trinickia terrae]